MKRIALQGKNGKGKFTLVDDEDYRLVKKLGWYFNKGYAQRIEYLGRKNKKSIRRGIQLHRLIMNAPKDQHVDHINGNGLDNRKSNLRLCSASQNLQNMSLTKCNTSGYKGVHWHKGANKWSVEIRAFGKRYYLGLFENLDVAAKAYRDKSLELHKEFSVYEREMNYGKDDKTSLLLASEQLQNTNRKNL